jgi:dipeptidyl aminopeptidase/acylaminoacyl peptidase
MGYLARDRRLPPILIVHGSKDRLVPFGQSVMMYDALKKLDKEAEMVQLKGADHGGTPFWSRDMLNLVDDFIRRHL